MSKLLAGAFNMRSTASSFLLTIFATAIVMTRAGDHWSNLRIEDGPDRYALSELSSQFQGRERGREGEAHLQRWNALLPYLRHHAKPVLGNEKPVIVLTWANFAYRAVLLNFMLALNKIGVSEYAIICTDEKIAELLSRIGRPCWMDSPFQGKRELWKMRMETLESVLDDGIDVVMSDADAIWLKSPFDLIYPYDISASRGSGFWGQDAKQRTHGKWAAAACMGFSSFRSNPSVVNFVRDEVRGKYQRDDQTSLNEAFLRNNLTFKTVPTYLDSTSIQDGKIKGKFGEIKVAWLDNRRFSRDCSEVNSSQVYVAHCRNKKDPKRLKAWFLPDNWEDKIGSDKALSEELGGVRTTKFGNEDVAWLKNASKGEVDCSTSECHMDEDDDSNNEMDPDATHQME